MEQRLTDLEILVMHQARTVEQLNEVVTEQQRTIDRISLELKMLREQLQGVVVSQNRLPSEEEPPPHY